MRREKLVNSTENHSQKTSALVFLICVMVFAMLAGGLVSCASPSQSSSSTTAQKQLYGKPWISSIFVGNLPETKPDVADDLYTHYSYDFIASHQDGVSTSVQAQTQGELKDSVSAIIKDKAQNTPELAQLRIFYNQAADLDALAAAGTDELKPYLKAIADTKSLDELEALLVSPDFPFTPWIDTTVSASDMKSNMCIGIMPHMLFSDRQTGTDMYLDSDDTEIQAARQEQRGQKTIETQDRLSMLSLCEETQAVQMTEKLFELEKAYGKDANQQKYLSATYGNEGQSVKAFTLAELTAAVPNFPIKETIAKAGGDASEYVMVMYPDWLTSFNSIWTEENFESLRAMTELKVLAECADFITPTAFAGTQQRLGKSTPSSDEVAWNACDRTDTFSQLLAKVYVEQVLGQKAVDELEKLSNDLIDTYISLVGKTSWLNEQSREKVIDKIDNMALNVLYPDGGYFDYSGLELVETEKGGTLLGNYLRLKAYNKKLEADLIGQPARAATLWLQVRPTLRNCYYDPVSNSINIYPGFVTSSMYKDGMSQEELLGGMGFTVGHEISHAFDYSWSQFDAYGRANPVFTEEDVSKFIALTQKVADYYSKIEIAPGKHLDGKTVEAEAVADLSGMQVIAERGKALDNFDYEKMFAKFAEGWAAVYPQEYAGTLMQGEHAPDNIRVNASAQMMDVFYDVFKIGEGNGMYLPSADRIIMWGENAR